jgi:glucokinase
VGVDVGEVNIRAALADMSGLLLAKATKPTEASLGIQHVLDRVVAAVGEVCSSAGKRAAALEIGYPGVINSDTGRVYGAPHIPGSEGFPILDTLKQRIPEAHLGIENDINLAALGECWRGAGGHYREDGVVAFLSFRTGIGAGVVINGQLFRGASGGAGEVGYLCGDPQFSLATPDSPGWMETKAGGMILVQHYQALVRGGHSSTPDYARGTDLESLLLDSTGEIEPPAAHLMEEAVRYYGLVLTNIVTVVDPNLVILGGIVPGMPPAAVESLIAGARAKIPRLPEVRVSMLGLDATMFGAVYEAMLMAVDMAKATVLRVPRLDRADGVRSPPQADTAE